MKTILLVVEFAKAQFRISQYPQRIGYLIQTPTSGGSIYAPLSIGHMIESENIILGYKYHVGREHVDTSRPPAWGKIHLMYQALEDPDIDWWLWFDCDTYFMNMTVTLDMA